MESFFRTAQRLPSTFPLSNVTCSVFASRPLHFSRRATGPTLRSALQLNAIRSPIPMFRHSTPGRRPSSPPLSTLYCPKALFRHMGTYEHYTSACLRQPLNINSYHSHLLHARALWTSGPPLPSRVALHAMPSIAAFHRLGLRGVVPGGLPRETWRGPREAACLTLSSFSLMRCRIGSIWAR